VNSQNTSVHIAAVSTALPSYRASQDEAAAFFRRHYSGRISSRSLKIMDSLLLHPGIKRRYFGLDSPDSLVDEDPDERIGRFLAWSVSLSERAAGQALREAGLSADDISVLIVNTCTGYICPGITSYLIESLGLRRDIRSFDLVGSGCGGAIPNITMGQSLLKSEPGGSILCVAVEICSATFQMSDDLSLILSNAIFGDGAAAAVLRNGGRGLQIISSSTRHLPEKRDIIRYVHRDGQLYNQLSRSLPKVIGETVAEAVHAALAGQNIDVSEVDHWAMHGGGESVINAVGKAVGLSDHKLIPTRRVLERYGNMSSPSVLFALREIIDNGIAPGQWCVMVAFGAGLSAHAMLLRATRPITAELGEKKLE
jgi:alkylresorcinol/alkylpyrone synthase